MIKELVIKNRSVRRYDNSVKLSRELLSELVDIGRLCASAGNLQRIRFATVCEEQNVRAVRELLGFAAYLKDWDGPTETENPSAYVVMLSEADDANLFVDIGIAGGAMLLGAVERGYNGCMFRSFDKEKLSLLLGIDGLTPRLVISLGKAAERVEITEALDDDIKYYRRSDDVHVVPKRPLPEVLIIEK